MERIKPPSDLDVDSSSLKDTWKEWREAWELYCISSGLSEKDVKVQSATIQSVLGTKARRVLKTLPDMVEIATDRTVAGILAALETYCIPRQNVTYERYLFRMATQGDRPFDMYLTELRRKAEGCEFGLIKESLIRDQIILGTNSPSLRERLLRTTDLSLEKAISSCRIAEQSKEHSKILSNEAGSEVDSVKRSQPNTTQYKKSQESSLNTSNKINNCKYCSSSHDRGKCPAYGQTCHNCNGRNHYARCCKRPQKQVRGVEYESAQDQYSLNPRTDHTEHGLFIGEVRGNNRKNIQSTLLVNDIPVEFKLDTGAECNILPENLVCKLNGEIKPTSVLLTSFGGHSLDTIGMCYINTKSSKAQSSTLIEYYIVANNVKPLLGLESCLQLGLISINQGVDKIGVNVVDRVQQKSDILDEFEDVFQGLGCVDGEYEIQLDKSVPPIIQGQRNIPMRLTDKLKSTLNNLERQGVISKVDEPVDWVSNLVIVEKKDGSLRICLDPPNLNEAIRREDYKPPTFEKISSTLNGCKIFSVVDMSNCYWHQRLTENSSFLCTFNSPVGRYRFKRMPFGISCASEVAQKMVEKHFGDIQGALPIYDDIIIAGRNEEEHDAVLRKVLSRARERNIKFNRSKIQFRVNRVKYMGEMVSEDGFSPDPDKISAILDMPKPTCKQDLQRLLGMINFLAKYVPNMSDLTQSLRSLLKKDIRWEWHPEHDTALVNLKKALISAPVLRFYDINQPTTLQVDASKGGLGACLLQNERPVAYASRALTSAEQNYAQIEKELLAIVFGCERFNMYTYGTEVEVLSDHKPLESIFKKPLFKVPPRLQRMRLRLQRFRIRVRYVPGKFLYIADTLSRAYDSSKVPENNDMHEDMENLIHAVIKSLPISDQKLKELREINKNDETFDIISKFCQEGWPTKKSDVPLSAKPFWNVRNEIFIVDGILLKDNRIIIPSVWRSDILEKVHTGHLGIEKCKAKARQTIYWPNMSKDIEEMVSRCQDCLTHQNKQPKEPMLAREIPHLPWQVIASDILEFKSTNYVVVIDYYSKYIEAMKLTNKTATNVIKNLEIIFSRHGYPERMIADNMPYNSREMRSYATDRGIVIATTSPTYSQSNGLAEKAVHIVKNVLKKGCDLNEGLMEYRNTPLSNFPYSPNQMLLSRQIRTKLPVHPNVLLPQVRSDVRRLLQERQNKVKMFYDRGAKDLKKLSEGDNVRFRKPANKYYSPARVTAKHASAPRSFLITDETGRVYRRNRRDLNISREPPVRFKQEFESETELNQVDDSLNQLDNSYVDLAQDQVVDTGHQEIRRSTRSKLPPEWHKDYVFST